MIENYGECRAFGLSLLLHFLLFLIAAALGLFSIAAPTGNKAPIDVVLYDAGGDTGSAGGDAAPAAAPAPAVDDIVVQDKTVAGTADAAYAEYGGHGERRNSARDARRARYCGEWFRICRNGERIRCRSERRGWGRGARLGIRSAERAR